MSMLLKKVTFSLPEYQDIKKLYKMAFPADERAPFPLMMLRAMQKKADFRSVYDNGEWAGMVYIMGCNGLYYIFYLAVAENKRNGGTGSRILKAVLERYKGKRIFLAIEHPDENADNYEMRVRRRNFYLRNGFKDLNKKITENTVTYDMLGIGEPASDEEYKKIMAGFLGSIAAKIIPLGIE